MFILSIIPISRGIPFNTLSYYNTDALSVGTLVEVPLGKQIIRGLVCQCNSLIEAKINIKQATFSLKKIKKVVGENIYATSLIEGLQEASIKTLTPIGSLAGNILNELFLDVLAKIPNKSSEEKEVEKSLSIYGTEQDRLDEYKRIIRSSFAEKRSVVFVSPSIRSLEYWHQILQKGINTHSVLLHSKITKREQKKILTTILSSDRPLFVCATPSFANIPRNDVSTIIIEDESSNLYKTNDRYESDMRIVLESIAFFSKIQVVYGDVLPRFETLHKTENTHLARSFTPEKLSVVPTEPYRTILPTETIELIRYCKKNKKSMFIYTNRKGLAPISRCADCGTSVDCNTCGLPVVLRYKIVNGERQRHFICNYCGDTLPTTHLCSYCGSWNITPVSVGTESIYDAVSSIIDPENIFTIDDDLTPDSKTVEGLLSDMQKSKWFIMIGTQKMLPYIKPVDFIAIPFFDRLLSVPSPVVLEEVLRLIMLCNEKTKDTLVVCTKKPDFIITKQLATKKIQEIIDSDLEAREVLKYPPFGTLIKLSVTVPSAHSELVIQKVTNFFKDIDITMMPIRRISPGSMKLLCVWIIQGNNDYLRDYGEDLQLFMQDIRFPYSLKINPNRL
ncbi:MAG: hypothetical protein KBC11_00305 [Candidatus Pacebacteria bacterium]|nr:hypothetical protein [Candidatus Paceibacterota bacterium]